MRYLLCFGKYYYKQAREGEFFSHSELTKRLKEAEWFTKESVEREQNKYGGVIKPFEIELEEVECQK